MTDMTPIARPYAQAAYEFAKEKGVVSNWSSMLLNLAESINNQDIQALLNNPVYTQQDIAELLISTLSQVLSEHMINLIRVIAGHKRLAVIPWIYALFLQYKSDDEKAKTATITTAYKTSAEYIEKLQQKLERKFNCAINVKTAIDPKLIGGALIEVGDLVIDGSIKGKLAKLQHELQA
ncbi:F0F1 ATP synthase subunit delta [Facilibium subflavum]|uniref:F0F1 ATP synthase subunit delta n=1 Tax=Facilibium subflavum TaxID=2219058 RepID=UPI000E64B65A|nr:F0F1 ATP synthase subunit delta [Facilibium subflavum]